MTCSHSKCPIGKWFGQDSESAKTFANRHALKFAGHNVVIDYLAFPVNRDYINTAYPGVRIKPYIINPGPIVEAPVIQAVKEIPF